MPIDIYDKQFQNWLKGVLTLNITRDALCIYVPEKLEEDVKNISKDELKQFFECLKKNGIVLLKSQHKPPRHWSCVHESCEKLMDHYAQIHVDGKRLQLQWNFENDQSSLSDKGISDKDDVIWSIMTLYMFTEKGETTDKYKSFNDLDISRLIKTMRNCTLFVPDGSVEWYDEVLKSRNELMHSPKNQMTEKQTQNIIDRARKLLEVLDISQKPFGREAMNELQELEEKDFVIRYQSKEYKKLVDKVLEASDIADKLHNAIDSGNERCKSQSKRLHEMLEMISGSGSTTKKGLEYEVSEYKSLVKNLMEKKKETIEQDKSTCDEKSEEFEKLQNLEEKVEEDMKEIKKIMQKEEPEEMAERIDDLNEKLKDLQEEKQKIKEELAEADTCEYKAKAPVSTFDDQNDSSTEESINKVIDRCWISLLENSNPVSMPDLFRKKDHFKQTDKSREIIIREKGKQSYHQIQLSLKETKQDSCLAKLKQIEHFIIKKTNQETHLHESNGRCRHSFLYSSLPDRLDTLSCKSEEQEMVPDESTVVSKKNDVNMLPKVQSDETKAQNQNERLQKAYFIPYLEDTIEQAAKVNLNDIGFFLKKKDVFKTLNIVQIYKEFAKKCQEIRSTFPDLTAERLLQQLHAGTQHPLESYSYTNTPSGFQACRSSGYDNSCFYRSVSLLLTGSEISQFSLRLLATLYAVKSLGIYRKHLLYCCKEDLMLFFHSLFDEQTMEKFSELKDTEALVDIFLKKLIMETACLGTDSSVLHVEFLSGALGIKIVQHFQHFAGYGRILQAEQWARIIQAKETNNSLPNLHIFWVNYSNTENGTLNHIVPLIGRELRG